MQPVRRPLEPSDWRRVETMSLESTQFDGQDQLKTPEQRAAYIEAAIRRNDAALLVKAIDEVIHTIGVKAFAEQTGLSRAAVYKALSMRAATRLSQPWSKRFT